MFDLAVANANLRYLGGYYFPKENVNYPKLWSLKYSKATNDKEVLLNGYVWPQELMNKTLKGLYQKNVNNGCTLYNEAAINDIQNWDTIGRM